MKRKRAAPWGNRIVGHGVKPARDFLANEHNWRIHPQAQQEVLGGVISAVGFVQSVIVNLRTDPSWGSRQNVETMLDGHARLQLALSRGEETEVPYIEVDLSPEEEALVLTTLDPISAMAGSDDAMLAEQIASMPDDLAALAKAIHETSKVDRLVSFSTQPHHRVVVECKTATAQRRLLKRLQEEGFECRAD